MIKLRSMKFCRSNSSSSKLAISGGATTNGGAASIGSTNKGGEIKWEVRPGGMLVQKRECADINGDEEIITLRVSTVSTLHSISIQPTSTFGELKMLMSLMIGLDPKEQRVLYKGKEREDYEYLHMVGVNDNDKLFLLQVPAKLHRRHPADQVVGSYHTISVEY